MGPKTSIVSQYIDRRSSHLPTILPSAAAIPSNDLKMSSTVVVVGGNMDITESRDSDISLMTRIEVERIHSQLMILPSWVDNLLSLVTDKIDKVQCAVRLL